MVFKICEGSCSSFSVKELDVIVHENYFPIQSYSFLAILYPTSLASLVVEVGTRHSHQQPLLSKYRWMSKFNLHEQRHIR